LLPLQREYSRGARRLTDLAHPVGRSLPDGRTQVTFLRAAAAPGRVSRRRGVGHALSVLAVCLLVGGSARRDLARAQSVPSLGIELPDRKTTRPLDDVTILGATTDGELVVSDGDGRPYFRAPSSARVTFRAGGSLGTHIVRQLAATGRELAQTTFVVADHTRLEEDTGSFQKLFGLALDTMTVQRPGGDDGAPRGGHDPRKWRGRTYQLFVPWVLDHAQTSKGMAFVSPHIRDGVLLFRDAQKADGMIWSFFKDDDGTRGYWDTAYGPLGYARHDGGLLFARQPVDNHSEYEFVDMLFRAWQASGDDGFMRQSLAAAIRALDYAIHDPVRYSTRFGLLKRPYSVDSWDFQIEDAYLVQDSLAPTMTIDKQKTKFGVFFGDNTGYIAACRRLATMLRKAGRQREASAFETRAAQLDERLRKVSWNGRYFRHFVEEDDSVQRDLGVDEASQIAQANMYSLNRGIASDQAAAILRTYATLRGQLPRGSPGEWYAIYPPFGRGVGRPEETWQYMNGGVSGHAASELARGAFAHGFESYGTDILRRSLALAERTDEKIHFAYTGAFPPPPAPQVFTPVSLRDVANMDTEAPSPGHGHGWMDERAGNDLARAPRTKLTAGGAPFVLLDPARNERRAVVAVARRAGYPRQVELPIAGRAGAVYLLHATHTGAGADQSSIAAALTFRYADGSERGLYLVRDEHVVGWWYPQLRRPHAGVAWRGPNQQTGDVGLSWYALANPRPDLAIRSIVLDASVSGAVYALAGLTLADRMPTRKRDVVSYGGPDNWSGSNMVLALIEGLAGVRDTDRGFDGAEVSPRWAATDARRATVVARYGASRGYVAYRFEHTRDQRRLALTLTGNGRGFRARLLLPPGTTPGSVSLDGQPAALLSARIESSTYAELDVPAGVHDVVLHYHKAP